MILLKCVKLKNVQVFIFINRFSVLVCYFEKCWIVVIFCISFFIQSIVNGILGSLGNVQKAVEREHGLTPERKMLPRHTAVNVRPLTPLTPLQKTVIFKNARVIQFYFNTRRTKPVLILL